MCPPLVLGQTQFVGSDFGIFGEFGWVHSSVLVDKLGFGRFGFSGFGPGFGLFLAEQVRSGGFLEGNCFEVRF